MGKSAKDNSPDSVQGQESEEPGAKQGTDNMIDSRLQKDIGFVLDIPIQITVELGRTRMLISELIKLGQGAVIELSGAAGETLNILANERLIAKGEVVVVNEKYGIRITEIIDPVERIEKLA
ncbi:MAG: flagellar motor switch protein FliN [Desulfococcaceae bacterium]|jgi:flagellar motor switch protein FliN/FliY|nr:flagellar motor switch protein FliN [Desulfococcaceae bacterium]